MTNISTHNCPACEYERGTAGRPVKRNNEIHCLDCGSSWKEYGNSVANVHQQPRQSEKSTADHDEIKRNLRQQYSTGTRDSDVYTATKTASEKTSSIGSMAIIMASSASLALAVAVVVFGLNHYSASPSPKGLHVQEVAFEEIIRPNGSKVVKVEGIISNDSATTEPLSRVAIVLRKTNGGELARWYHRSSTRLLKPGKKSRFVTAMSVQAPMIASVDAVIE